MFARQNHAVWDVCGKAGSNVEKKGRGVKGQSDGRKPGWEVDRSKTIGRATPSANDDYGEGGRRTTALNAQRLRHWNIVAVAVVVLASLGLRRCDFPLLFRAMVWALLGFGMFGALWFLVAHLRYAKQLQLARHLQCARTERMRADRAFLLLWSGLAAVCYDNVPEFTAVERRIAIGITILLSTVTLLLFVVAFRVTIDDK